MTSDKEIELRRCVKTTEPANIQAEGPALLSVFVEHIILMQSHSVGLVVTLAIGNYEHS